MLPRAEFLASLPKKRMAASALIRDTHGNVLIVKPTYRADWLVPGGSVEADESPFRAAQRETEEEVGLKLDLLRLLLVDYQPASEDTNESLQFVFDGGTIDAQQIAQIKLPLDELSEWRLVPLETAVQLLAPKLARRIHIAYTHPDQTHYAENGRAIFLDDL